MPAYRRSVSVPARCRPSTTPSSFDDPSLDSFHPSTPVYGRHTGLEGYAFEGSSQTTPDSTREPTRTVPTTDLARQLERLCVYSTHREISDSSLVLNSSSPLPTQATLTPSLPFPECPNSSTISPTIPDPVSELVAPASPSSSRLDLLPEYELYDPIATDPQDLPLPSPPQEGEYIFPDSDGRASLVSTPPRLPDRFLPQSLPSPPPSLRRTIIPTSRQVPVLCTPAKPKLEPTRNLLPSPPSGRLSAFSPSPRSMSPAPELEFPLLDSSSHTPAQLPKRENHSRGQRGRKGFDTTIRDSSERQSPSSSPTRGYGTSRDCELEKARERIKSLEKEVETLRRKLVQSQARGRM